MLCVLTDEACAVQVFLANMDDFVAVNAIYSKFFGEHKPARSAVQVARLPLSALFEIECIARRVCSLFWCLHDRLTCATTV